MPSANPTHDVSVLGDVEIELDPYAQTDDVCVASLLPQLTALINAPASEMMATCVSNRFVANVLHGSVEDIKIILSGNATFATAIVRPGNSKLQRCAGKLINSAIEPCPNDPSNVANQFPFAVLAVLAVIPVGFLVVFLIRHRKAVGVEKKPESFSAWNHKDSSHLGNNTKSPSLLTPSSKKNNDLEAMEPWSVWNAENDTNFDRKSRQSNGDVVVRLLPKVGSSVRGQNKPETISLQDELLNARLKREQKEAKDKADEQLYAQLKREQEVAHARAAKDATDKAFADVMAKADANRLKEQQAKLLREQQFEMSQELIEASKKSKAEAERFMQEVHEAKEKEEREAQRLLAIQLPKREAMHQIIPEKPKNWNQIRIDPIPDQADHPLNLVLPRLQNVEVLPDDTPRTEKRKKTKLELLSSMPNPEDTPRTAVTKKKKLDLLKKR